MPLKGLVPWNKGLGIITKCTCQFCGKQFELPEPQVKRRRGIYCGRECFYNAKKKFGRRVQITTLYQQGKPIKQIAVELGILPSTVSSMISYMKLADRQGDGVYSQVHKYRLKRLLSEQYNVQSCEICGYDRITEIAHVLERKNGGTYILDNCILLCPNCHHLFDHNRLSEVEKDKLAKISRLNGNLKRRLGYVTIQ